MRVFRSPRLTAMCRRISKALTATSEKFPSHGTSRFTWAQLLARIGEELPQAWPKCGDEIWLINLITEPGPFRKILVPSR